MLVNKIKAMIIILLSYCILQNLYRNSTNDKTYRIYPKQSQILFASGINNMHKKWHVHDEKQTIQIMHKLYSHNTSCQKCDHHKNAERNMITRESKLSSRDTITKKTHTQIHISKKHNLRTVSARVIKDDLVMFLLQHRFSHQAPNPKQTISVKLARSDIFWQRAKDAGVLTLKWVDPTTEMRTDVKWVEHASSWWNIAPNVSMSPFTIADMRSRHGYENIAMNYAAGLFKKAAKLLSNFKNGIDAWPSVAIVLNAVIFSEGQIYNRSHLFYGKGCNSAPQNLLFHDFHAQYEIVATIAEFWGEGYFHFVAENLIRLPLVLPVIENLNSSLLHVKSINTFSIEMLTLLGIQRTRLLSGIVSARVALMPEPIQCGTPPALLLQLLRRTLVQKTNALSLEKQIQKNKCNILLVQRKGPREIRNHDALLSCLSRSFSLCEIHVHTGRERVKDQLQLFRRATVVLAPHGAGLSNIVVCNVGTIVMEFITTGRAVNICYMAMALKLELRYIALYPLDPKYGMQSQYSSMFVDVNDTVNKILRFT